MNAAQRAFIDPELFQLTLGAASQLGAVYAQSLTEAARRPVHGTTGELLEEL